MKKWLVFFVVVLLVIPSAVAPPPSTTEEKGGKEELKPDSPDAWQNNEFAEKATPQQVKVGLDKGVLNSNFDKLDAEDLVFDNNLNKLTPDQKKQLDPQVLEEALSKLSGGDVNNVGLGGGDVTGGTDPVFENIDAVSAFDTDFSVLGDFASVESDVDDAVEAEEDGFQPKAEEGILRVTNGEGFERNGNTISIDRADSIIVERNDGLIEVSTNVEDFQATPTTFFVASADLVKTGDLIFTNVRNTVFTVGTTTNVIIDEETFREGDNQERNSIRIQPQNGSIVFKDASSTEAVFTGDALIINQDEESPVYKLNNGRVTITTELVGKETKTFVEEVESNNKATIVIKPSLGIEAVELEPVGSYIYREENIENTFALVAEKVKHSIRLRKASFQDLANGCIQCTTVDFVTKKLTINGMVDYRRFFYQESFPINLINPTLVSHFNPLSNASCMLTLDDKLSKVNIAEVRNANVNNEVAFNNFVSMRDTTDNRRKLFFNLNTNEGAKNIITKYHAVSFPNARVEKEILIQPWKNSQIKVLPPNHELVGVVFE